MAKMSGFYHEFMKIKGEYEELLSKYNRLFNSQQELNRRNMMLNSENEKLREIVCEKYEIREEVLDLNLRLIHKEQALKARNCAVKDILKRNNQNKRGR